jgi:phage-related protein
MRRRLTHARTHAPLTWFSRTPRQHDGCHAFLWKNSSCYHHLVISTDTWSACYHHLVSSTCISACYHNYTSTNARSFNMVRTHSPSSPRQHDGCHAFLWKNSSCYHHLVISTYAWSCYHPSRDWHARPFTRLMRPQSSCYHHLVSSTDASTCSHHAIISL